MTPTQNPYETLGVPKGATEEDIKKAYRKKSSESHPDRGGDPEEFKHVAEAYDVLSTTEKREYYDKTGETGDPAQAWSNAEKIMLTALEVISLKIIESGINGDMFELARNLVPIKDAKQKKKECLQAISRLKKHRKSIKQKNKKEKDKETIELVLCFVDNKINRCQGFLKEANQNLDDHEEAIKMLKGLKESGSETEIDRHPYAKDGFFGVGLAHGWRS